MQPEMSIRVSFKREQCFKNLQSFYIVVYFPFISQCYKPRCIETPGLPGPKGPPGPKVRIKKQNKSIMFISACADNYNNVSVFFIGR